MENAAVYVGDLYLSNRALLLVVILLLSLILIILKFIMRIKNRMQ